MIWCWTVCAQNVTGIQHCTGELRVIQRQTAGYGRKKGKKEKERKEKKERKERKGRNKE